MRAAAARLDDRKAAMAADIDRGAVVSMVAGGREAAGAGVRAGARALHLGRRLRRVAERMLARRTNFAAGGERQAGPDESRRNNIMWHVNVFQS